MNVFNYSATYRCLKHSCFIILKYSKKNLMQYVMHEICKKNLMYFVQFVQFMHQNAECRRDRNRLRYRIQVPS